MKPRPYAYRNNAKAQEQRFLGFSFCSKAIGLDTCHIRPIDLFLILLTIQSELLLHGAGMARISFRCPQCDKVLNTSTRPTSGKKVRCPECGEIFVPEIDDDDATGFQKRPSVKRTAAADDPDEEDEERHSRKTTKVKQSAGGGALLVIVLLLLGGGGGVLFLLCGGVALTAFVWPGFLIGKGEKIAAKDQKANPDKFNYYPVEVGNNWHYRVTANGNLTNASMRISRHDVINGEKLARLDFLNGPVTEHIAQTEKGVFRHGINGSQLNPPLRLLPYPPDVGTKWEGNFTSDIAPGKNRYFGEIQQEEMVDVPAGRFKALRVHLRVEQFGPDIQTTYWFVKDVGFVKQAVNIQGLPMTMELERFEIKKGPAGP